MGSQIHVGAGLLLMSFPSKSVISRNWLGQPSVWGPEHLGPVAPSRGMHATQAAQVRWRQAWV